MGYGKIYKAQGRYVVMNRVVYFSEIRQDVDLHENNYHYVVNLLIRLLNNTNSLRVGAP